MYIIIIYGGVACCGDDAVRAAALEKPPLSGSSKYGVNDIIYQLQGNEGQLGE